MFPVASCSIGKGGAADKDPPRIIEAAVSPEGDVLTLLFNEPLDQNYNDTGWQLIDSDTNEHTFIFVEFAGPTWVTMTNAGSTIPSQPATLSVLETDGGPFRDLRGNQLPSQVGLPVTNNVP